VRVGTGFDLHRLEVGRPLILGGVELPWDLGLSGHSDADVICHALIDALCGAAGIGDIGTLFPDTDPQYKDARSLDLLREVTDHCRRGPLGSRERGASRCWPRRPNWPPIGRRSVPTWPRPWASIRPPSASRAPRLDHVGAIGRGEALAAQAVVLLRELP